MFRRRFANKAASVLYLGEKQARRECTVRGTWSGSDGEESNIKRRGYIPLPGWGAGIRTPIGRSRVGSPTVERHPNTCTAETELSAVCTTYDTPTIASCQAPCGGVCAKQAPDAETRYARCAGDDHANGCTDQEWQQCVYIPGLKCGYGILTARLIRIREPRYNFE
jgi:hypothetical protein